jgi:DNA-directed RNA polymerase subunit F
MTPEKAKQVVEQISVLSRYHAELVVAQMLSVSPQRIEQLAREMVGIEMELKESLTN